VKKKFLFPILLTQETAVRSSPALQGLQAGKNFPPQTPPIFARLIGFALKFFGGVYIFSYVCITTPVSAQQGGVP